MPILLRRLTITFVASLLTLAGFLGCAESDSTPLVLNSVTPAPTTVATNNAPTATAVPANNHAPTGVLVSSPTPASQPSISASAEIPNTVTPATATAATPTATSETAHTPTPIALVISSDTTVIESAFSAVTSSPVAESLADRVWNLAMILAEDLSPRESATAEELAAAVYLAGEFSDLGYETEIVPFEVTEGFPRGTLSPVQSDGDESLLMFDTFGGPTPYVRGLPVQPIFEGTASGELEYVGRGTKEELVDLDLKGKVALVEYVDDIESMYSRLLSAGVDAIVIYDSVVRNHLVWSSMPDKSEIPMFIVRRIHGLKLIDEMDAGNEIFVDVIAERYGNGPSRNIVAELNNNVENDGVIIIGAHYDTTPESSGANDNGSGMAVSMVLAEELLDDDLPFDVRFVLFGSEETGLHGSKYYVETLSDDESERVLGMINLDAMGAGKVQIFGTDSMESLAYKVADAARIELSGNELDLSVYGSDHQPFMEAGYEDVLWLSADVLEYINSPRDTLEHVELEPMIDSFLITLGIIERLAETEAR